MHYSFQIDGKHNPKIQSIFFEGFPVQSAHFSQDGTEVIVASKHRSFKYYDMIAGQIITVPKIKGRILILIYVAFRKLLCCFVILTKSLSLYSGFHCHWESVFILSSLSINDYSCLYIV